MFKRVVIILTAIIVTILVVSCSSKKLYEDKLYTETIATQATVSNTSSVNSQGAKPMVNNIEEILNEQQDYNEAYIEIYDILCEKCAYGDSIDKLSKCERIIYLVGDLESEVNNGGFSQFFFNNSGRYANETIDALKSIDAKNTAPLLKEAISIAENSIASWKADGDELTEEQNKKLNLLDNKFFEYKDNLLMLQINYIKEHINDF